MLLFSAFMNVETSALLFRLPIAAATNPAFAGAPTAAGRTGHTPVKIDPRGVIAAVARASYWYLVGPDGTHPRSDQSGSVLVPPAEQNVAAVAGIEGVNSATGQRVADPPTGIAAGMAAMEAKQPRSPWNASCEVLMLVTLVFASDWRDFI